MGCVHEVSQGECLTRIARQYGFAEDSLRGHPQNAELFRRRKNSNVLHPDDHVFVPAREAKWEAGATERRHRFSTGSGRRLLRIALEERAGRPMKRVAYELTVGGVVHRGTTNENGQLEEKIPLAAEEGTLKVKQFVWPLLIGHLNPLEDVNDNGISGVQARLRNLGYHAGPVNGQPGPVTTAALRQFQADMNLDATGDVDRATRSRLIEEHGC
jgi:Putative peptidoglycan binding domain